ncbi:FAD-dependent oxidoreductase [Novosphingobium sp. Leaf2]|uniref:FAD-dependent oxidoreductase n=1 Tax=Novosphingobium sp. Leaf2 TaxID=1735670 RepID=UPI0006FCB00B|nr:GMC family oxidoreductase [Novosphingobium sp. Leaf2]KQM18237.1 GMC family oxidoreductase [Novosphingobium sp. Leaf2]
MDADVIVVGSGISGGWAAKELTERGFSVLLLERGRNVVAGTDYTTEHLAPFQLPYRGFGDRQRYARDYKVQSKVAGLSDAIDHWFVNDTQNPYQTSPEAEFAWIRGYHLGGRSITWGRASFRLAPLNFAEAGQDGHGIPWPIGYDDLAPWYAHVERFIGVNGDRDGIPSLPDGEFMPPHGMNCVEEHMRDAVAQKMNGRRIINERSAVLTRQLGDRLPCHYCGPCIRGCSTGSYFSSESSTLPAAQATGRLKVMTDVVVDSLVYDPSGRRVTAVRVIDAKTRKRSTLGAKVVFLNASTLGSTQILLNSIDAGSGRSFANRSDALGRYLMDHVMGPFGIGTIPGFGDRQPLGNRPSGIYIPRFQNVATRDRPFARGYGYQGSASRQMWTRGADGEDIGAGLKHRLRQPGPWQIFIGGMGECMPYADNRVTLAKDTDPWGRPQLDVAFTWHANELAMAKDMAAEAQAMLHAAGATDFAVGDTLGPGGLAIHEMGTARMGADPAKAVLNAHNQCHDAANVFVTDGACMTASAAQNPSLTYMALTARAASFAADQMKQGVL